MNLDKASNVMSVDGNLHSSSFFRGNLEEQSEVVLRAKSVEVPGDIIADNSMAKHWWNVVLG